MKLELSEDILFMAFRYALGRQTYVVSDVVQTITENWSFLSKKIKHLIHKEIKIAISDKNIGMEMDFKEWSKVLNLKINND